jgi:TAT (twin-arginine translocation) pathway signal sequence
MEPVSRRQFFKHAGSAAAIAVVAGAATSSLGVVGAGASALGAKDHESPLAPHEELTTDESLVAHVKNSRTGEISLFIGHREVTLHDRKVAARLIRASR